MEKQQGTQSVIRVVTPQGGNFALESVATSD